MKLCNDIGVSPTRFPDLGYARLDATTWQFVSLEDKSKPSQVGPFYRSKAELLADLERYAREVWGY